MNKSYLVWDVANADFIYKKFPRAEFSYLLDFTDRSDNTVVRKVAPDGEILRFLMNTVIDFIMG